MDWLGFPEKPFTKELALKLNNIKTFILKRNADHLKLF